MQLKPYFKNWKIFGSIVKDYKKNLNIINIFSVSKAYSQRGFNEY